MGKFIASREFNMKLGRQPCVLCLLQRPPHDRTRPLRISRPEGVDRDESTAARLQETEDVPTGRTLTTYWRAPWTTGDCSALESEIDGLDVPSEEAVAWMFLHRGAVAHRKRTGAKNSSLCIKDLDAQKEKDRSLGKG